MSIWLEFCESSSKNVRSPDCGGQVFLDGHQAPIIKLKSKRRLKSPLEAKIQKTDPIGFFYEQKCPFDENLVYPAQKLSKPLFFMSSDFEIGVPFLRRIIPEFNCSEEDISKNSGSEEDIRLFWGGY